MLNCYFVIARNRERHRLCFLESAQLLHSYTAIAKVRTAKVRTLTQEIIIIKLLCFIILIIILIIFTQNSNVLRVFLRLCMMFLYDLVLISLNDKIIRYLGFEIQIERIFAHIRLWFFKS